MGNKRSVLVDCVQIMRVRKVLQAKEHDHCSKNMIIAPKKVIAPNGFVDCEPQFTGKSLIFRAREGINTNTLAWGRSAGRPLIGPARSTY
jgi:hypothetical protein